MGFKDFYKKYENFILASAFLLGLLLFVGVRYDYYYDLNDDVLIKDLMAGVYTGEPEGHNIQVLYPLSLAISLGYRIFPRMPVYGIFMLVPVWLFVVDNGTEPLLLQENAGKNLFGGGGSDRGLRIVSGASGFCAIYGDIRLAFCCCGVFVFDFAGEFGLF